MLDFASPQDDGYQDLDEDSSVSTVIRDERPLEEQSSVDSPRRTSNLNDCKRIAVERAKYFRRKYAAERVVGGGLFLLTSPLVALLIVLVRLTSKGPGIYRQERVGLHGETFNVYKLRSMYVDAEKGGRPVWCAKNDSRITPLGSFLRRTHLDELPQLWNVVKGEMCLTGPRPERPAICEVLATIIDDYYHRNVVKPGVTGLAQINLEPDETVADVKRKQFLDLHYIQNAGLWLDVRMLSATALRVVGIRGGKAMSMLKLCRASVVADNVVILPEDNRKLFPDASDQPATSANDTVTAEISSTDTVEFRPDRPHSPK